MLTDGINILDGFIINVGVNLLRVMVDIIKEKFLNVLMNQSD